MRVLGKFSVNEDALPRSVFFISAMGNVEPGGVGTRPYEVRCHDFESWR